MRELLICTSVLLLLVACTTQPSEEQQLPNPASVYCEEQGGTLQIVDDAAGQYGVCTLPDGTACEEWAYYRGECP